jgi:hypothetical protein
MAASLLPTDGRYGKQISGLLHHQQGVRHAKLMDAYE